MTLTDQVLNQAELLTGSTDEAGRERLRLLCTVAAATLKGQLRQEVDPEDIREEFVAAASLCAYSGWQQREEIQEFRAGDLTVKKGQPGTLETQALQLLRHYLKNDFAFMGV